MSDTNRRRFLAGIAVLFGLRKRSIMKPRSLGMTTLFIKFTANGANDSVCCYQQLMEEHYSRVLSVACGEPLEFKFDLSKAEDRIVCGR